MQAVGRGVGVSNTWHLPQAAQLHVTLIVVPASPRAVSPILFSNCVDSLANSAPTVHESSTSGSPSQKPALDLVQPGGRGRREVHGWSSGCELSLLVHAQHATISRGSMPAPTSGPEFRLRSLQTDWRPSVAWPGRERVSMTAHSFAHGTNCSMQLGPFWAACETPEEELPQGQEVDAYLRPLRAAPDAVHGLRKTRRGLHNGAILIRQCMA